MMLFNEANGKASYSRVSGTIVILAWLGIAVVQAVKGQAPTDIPLGWASIVVGLYGLNKVPSIMAGAK